MKIVPLGLFILPIAFASLGAKCAPEAKTIAADAAARALACEAAAPDPLSAATLERCAEESGLGAAADVLLLLQRAEAAHAALAARGFVVPPIDAGAP